MPKYSFEGHKTIEAHVARCLQPLGWTSVSDASLADIVFTYFSSSTALEDAYFDSDGLIKRSKPGTLLVDLSPATPALVRELSAVATVNDLRPIEAPLSVLNPVAPDAFASLDNLVCYVAGEKDDVDEVIDVIETLAGKVERTGTAGTAQVAKVTSTIQAAALIACSVESEAYARAVRQASTSLDGINKEVCRAYAGTSPLIDAVSNDSFEGTYTIEMFMGEVAAAMTAADDVELILPQLESVMHLLEVIAVIGGADKSPAALALMYREEAASAAAGLDWTRAEGLFSEYVHDHDYDHDHEFEDDYGFGDDYGIYGGLGGYSAN